MNAGFFIVKIVTYMDNEGIQQLSGISCFQIFQNFDLIFRCGFFYHLTFTIHRTGGQGGSHF